MLKSLSVRSLVVVSLVGVLASLLSPMQRPALAAAPSYISVMISRSTSQEADAACKPYAGTVRIDDVAAGLARRGIKTVVGSLVVDWADAATNGSCVPWFDSDGVRQGQTTAAGWPQAATLRDNRGWRFVSHSKSYTELDTITDALLRKRETCDTINTFRARGHNDAAGMFNFPNNQTNSIVSNLVGSCFSYGRKYGGQVNTKASSSVPPHTLWSRSVSGGRCNNPNSACYNMSGVVKDRRYTPPSTVAALLRPKAGQYAIAQFYRFVSGKRTVAAGPRWDCTSANPNNHWTTAPETYCINDLWAAIAGRAKTAIVTHPAAVAKAWGRSL